MDLWVVLFPILLTDVMNPVLFAFMVFAAGSNRPVALSSAVLLGHTSAYLSSGLVLALSAWTTDPATARETDATVRTEITAFLTVEGAFIICRPLEKSSVEII